ncbi:hypothetical protein IWQ61_003048 [Dispira simplex]|nr:hypothetical protein IWQ61_003048 [Dispira simplex]
MASTDTIRQRKPVSLSLFGHSSEDDNNGETLLTPELDRRNGKGHGGHSSPQLSNWPTWLGPITQTQLIIIAVLTVVGAYYRLWQLSNPSQVVFDEVHFGKFAGHYINRTFFFDVHPPLAKLMFAGMGKLVGYDGKFDFKSIGLDYLAAKVPYYGMRFMPAFLGLLTIPICYLTVKFSGHSTEAAVLGALLITFENSLVTQSRLILLDSPLIFFTTLTVLMWTNFCRYLRKPLTKWWWIWLSLTGIGMGLTFSCKWVGLFLVATIGVSTLKQLWDLVCDLRVTPKQFTQQFLARALCLIVIPISIYVTIFQIHFMVLHRTGSGASFVSPEMQSTLRGASKGSTLRDVYYGSMVNIRHDASNKGWLHSHPHSYPRGSKQQQVTLYPHRDENNDWLITKSLQGTRAEQNATHPPTFEPVKHGDIVRFVHTGTDRRLHSHDVRGPISQADYENEVSGYGWKGFAGDANDHWRIEIVGHDPENPKSEKRIMAIETRFRLVHVNLGCYLFSNSKKLPEWGFNQTEVICMKDAKVPKSTWRIDRNTYDLAPADAPKVRFSTPGLFSKVIELSQVMYSVNDGLTSSHPFDSRPEAWPYLRRGISFWSRNNRQIYLLGNPVVWWASSVAVILFLLVQGILHFTDIRGLTNPVKWNTMRTQYTVNVGFAVVAWAFHYLPFFILKRQLFLHHYLPALYFAILALTFSLDAVAGRWNARARALVYGVVALMAMVYFSTYSPITYGTLWTRAKCNAAKMLPTWDFDCRLPPVDKATTLAEERSTASQTQAPANDKPLRRRQHPHGGAVAQNNADDVD